MTPFEMIRVVFMGVAISAPIGPISFLCMRTTVRFGLIPGLCAGLGAAAADGLACLAALSGLGPIVNANKLVATAINATAVVFLAYTAIEILLARGEEPAADMAQEESTASCNPYQLKKHPASTDELKKQLSNTPKQQGPGGSGKRAGRTFISTFLFTALNPITLFTFVALFCHNNNNNGVKAAETTVLTSFCIFCGSALWWLVLSLFLSHFRGFLSPRLRKCINLVSAIVLLGFSICLICGLCGSKMLL